jgi:hypothetical protein
VTGDPEQHGQMRAPIVVHRPSPTGGRRVSMRRGGRDEILGLAHSDHDLAATGGLFKRRLHGLGE